MLYSLPRILARAAILQNSHRALLNSRNYLYKTLQLPENQISQQTLQKAVKTLIGYMNIRYT